MTEARRRSYCSNLHAVLAALSSAGGEPITTEQIKAALPWLAGSAIDKLLASTVKARLVSSSDGYTLTARGNEEYSKLTAEVVSK